MSKLERTAWVSLIVESAVAIYYFSAIFAMGPNINLHGPAVAGLIGRVIMLAIILGIIAEVVMTSLVSRAHDKVPEDERDALISARAYRNAYFALAICIAALIGHIVLSAGGRTWWISEILNLTPVYAAHLMLLALMLSSFVMNLSRIIYYRFS